MVATIAAARAAGFASLSMDLLADLPDLPFDAWTASLNAAIALAPDHLSVYALTLSLGPDESGDDRLATPAGAVAWRERTAAAQDEERGALELEHLNSRLPAAGYDWYEISNWATTGHASRHNTLYWERASVAAVGPGAHAFDGVTRRWNSANLDAWEGALQQGELPQVVNRSPRAALQVPQRAWCLRCAWLAVWSAMPPCATDSVRQLSGANQTVCSHHIRRMRRACS